MWNKNQILVLRNILSPKDMQFLLFWSGFIRFLCNYICFEKNIQNRSSILKRAAMMKVM